MSLLAAEPPQAEPTLGGDTEPLRAPPDAAPGPLVFDQYHRYSTEYQKGNACAQMSEIVYDLLYM